MCAQEGWELREFVDHDEVATTAGYARIPTMHACHVARGVHVFAMGGDDVNGEDLNTLKRKSEVADCVWWKILAHVRDNNDVFVLGGYARQKVSGFKKGSTNVGVGRPFPVCHRLDKRRNARSKAAFLCVSGSGLKG